VVKWKLHLISRAALGFGFALVVPNPKLRLLDQVPWAPRAIPAWLFPLFDQVCLISAKIEPV
jgi:hypothetical protein